MSLLDRVTCRIEGCRRERVKDALYCAEHLNDAWALRPSMEPEWMRRRRVMGLPAKDMTRAA